MMRSVFTVIFKLDIRRGEKKRKLICVRRGRAEKKMLFPECQRKHALIGDMGQYTLRNELIPPALSIKQPSECLSQNLFVF